MNIYEDVVHAPSSAQGCSSKAGDSLDELDHLVLLDNSGAIQVELFEAVVEVLVGECSAFSDVSQGVLHKFLGLFLVQTANVVVVVLHPILVNPLADHGVNFVTHLSLFFIAKF